MRWKTILFLVVFLCLMAPVLAASKVAIEPVKNSITLSETAYFNLTIENKAGETQKYSVFSFVLGWDVETSPLKDKIMEIPAGGNRSTLIKVLAKDSFNPGIYKLALNVETDLGEKYTESLNVYVSPDKPVDYLPSIAANLEMDSKIDPQKPVTIKLGLENRNPLNLSDLSIKITSDIPELNKETSLSLPPLAKKNVEFTLSLNPYQKPGDYYVFFTLERNKEVVKIIPQSIKILPLVPPFQKNITLEEAFLQKTRKIVITNLGNVKATQNVTLPISFRDMFFVKSTAKIDKINGERVLVWPVTLYSQESVVLTVLYVYRSLLYLSGILVVCLIIYLYLRPSLTVRKTAIAARQDATISELKITLNLKNLSKHHLRELEVVDLIPGIADIEKNLDVGTLRPQEIKHTSRGTYVKWKLLEIEPKEHRLITYKIKAKLKIVGALRLPRAKVVYHKDKRKRTAYSNIYGISSNQK